MKGPLESASMFPNNNYRDRSEPLKPISKGPSHEDQRRKEYEVGNACVERRETQVERSVSDLAKSAAVLAELVANLEQRLAPVLRPMTPTTNGPISKDEPTCGLADVLNGLNSKISHSNNFIARMLDLLEL